MPNGNPFYVDPQLDVTPALAGLGQTIERIGERKRAEARFNEVQGAMQNAWQSGDPDQMMQVSIQYPEARETMQMAFGMANEKTAAISRDTYQRILVDPENAEEHLTRGIDGVSEYGGRPNSMMSDLGMWRRDPKAAYKKIMMSYAATDPEGYRYIKDGVEEKFKAKELDIKQETLDIRREENEARKMEQSLQRETNELKKDELRLKIDEKRDKIEQSRQKVQQTAQSAADSLDRGIDTVDRLLEHPGLEAAVGTTAALPSIPGTDRADFEAELESFDAQLFTTAVKQMRGMGALSDAEGRKISAAAGAIKPTMSEKAFKASLQTIKDGFKKARQRMSEQGVEPRPVETTTSIDDLVSKYAD